MALSSPHIGCIGEMLGACAQMTKLRRTHRIYECLLRKGMRPVVVNPRPGNPYRTLSYGKSGWTATPEKYSPYVELRLHAADVERALEEFPKLLRDLKQH